MKDFTIDGKTQRVFVLTQSDTRVVYIPLKDLHRVDYDRLVEFDKEEGELMKVLARSVLDNGMNALTQFESLLQIMDINADGQGTRVRKPVELQSIVSSPNPTDQNSTLLAILSKLTEVAVAPAPAPVAPPESAPVAPPAQKRAAQKRAAPQKK